MTVRGRGVVRTTDDERGMVRTVMGLLGPYRLAVGGVIAASVVAAVIEAAVLGAIAASAVALAASHTRWTSSVLGWSPSVRTALLISFGGLAAALVIRTVSTSVTAKLCRASLETARNELLTAYVSGSWERVALEQEGDLQTLLVANSTVLAQATLAALRGVTSAGSLVVLVAASFVISPAASAVVVAVVGGALLAMAPLNRRSLSAGKGLARANLRFGRYLAQLQSNILEVQGLGVGEPVLQTGRAHVADIAEPFGRQIAYTTLSPVLFQELLLVVLVGGLLLIDVEGGVSVAALGAAVLMLLRASVFGQLMQAAWQQVVQSAHQIEAMADMRGRLSESLSPAGTARIESVTRIDVDAVGYSPPGAAPVLEAVTLSICAGGAVGVVGPSGSGKTTLLRLLLKLTEPDRGRIVVNDDVDLASVCLEDWRRLVSFVPQHPQLLAGSVAENVRYFRPEISDAAIADACQRAGLALDGRHEIDQDRLLDGYGGRISGGQRQRIAIARALAAKPQVLLLDEPTSALDERTEDAIRATLASLKGEGTALVVVAHRPGLLSICDEVIELNDRRTHRRDQPMATDMPTIGDDE